MIGRVPVRLVLPALAAVLTAAVWFVPEPEPPVVDGGSSEVSVRQTTWACPVGSGWTVAAGQVVAGSEAVARAIPEEAAVDPVWSDADRWRTAKPGGQALLLEQAGEGSGSVGYTSGVRSGDAVLGSCPSIVDEAWFVGLGDGDRSDATITLINLGENRAVADLTWWGANGPIESLDTSGLVVEPGERRQVEVEAVAAGEGAVAVNVSRRRGALTAVALDAGGAGADLLAPTSSMTTTQTLTGLPPGDQTRLAVVNPGTSTAHVTVDVLGPRGPFAAEGLDDLTIEPESTRVVTVPASVDLKGAGLAITSDLPVAASATVSTDGDIARVAPASEIGGQAVVPVRLAGRDLRLTLTAGEATAEITVEAFTATMESLGESTVTVESGSTITVPKPTERQAAYLVLTATTDAPFTAGLWQADDGRIASAAVRPAPVSVIAPGVSVR